MSRWGLRKASNAYAVRVPQTADGAVLTLYPSERVNAFPITDASYPAREVSTASPSDDSLTSSKVSTAVVELVETSVGLPRPPTVESDGETCPRGRAGVGAGEGDKLRLERHYSDQLKIVVVGRLSPNRQRVT